MCEILIPPQLLTTNAKQAAFILSDKPLFLQSVIGEFQRLVLQLVMS